MSDTPRTDEFLASTTASLLEVKDFMRQLERELASLTAERDKFRSSLEKIAQSDDSEGGCYYTNKGNIRLAGNTLREAAL